MARLALNSTKTQLAIGKAGAVTALVNWLTTDNPGPGMMELAARSLADIGDENHVTSQKIVDAGAIGPLVKMLESGKGNDAQKSAAGCLATLTQASYLEDRESIAAREATHLREVSAQENEQKAAHDASVLRAIEKAGRAKMDPLGMPLADPGTHPADPGMNLADPVDCASAPAPEPAMTSVQRWNLSTAAAIADACGIPPLVELLKSERVGPHENASRAIWQLAHTSENQMAIAEAGGIPPLVHLLAEGSEATKRHAAAAIEGLSKDCPENQLSLAKAKAIAPLVQLLGSDSMETQGHATGALLFLATHPECRNAVVRRLVQVLDLRNANAQMRAAGALAVLSARNVTYRNAIAEAGAVPPLVRQLGDGLRVENDTPQERAACVLADLARASECKDEIVQSGGVEPLVRMLGSTSDNAQTAACIAVSHLACTGENKLQIVNSGGIVRLVTVLADDNKDAKRHATAALCQLANSIENKMEIVQAGGIPLLVQVMIDDPLAQEAAAATLSELARSQFPQKQAIVDAGGLATITSALKDGTPNAQKHSASALWGLATVPEFRRPIVDHGAVPALVALLRTLGDAQGYATATLNNVAEIGDGKKAIFMALGVEPLLEIARGADRAWLRNQAVEVLTLLNIKDPLANTSFQPDNLSPRTPRTGAMSARGGSGATGATGSTDDPVTGRRGGGEGDPAANEPYTPPADPATMMMRMATKKVLEVAGGKALQLRLGFDLSSDKAGELPPKKAFHVLEERMTDDGKTRMAVAAEGGLVPLGWITGAAADGKRNTKEVGMAVMQVIAAKPLAARESFELTSPKVKELGCGVYIHVTEHQLTHEGAHRIAYAFEGKDQVKGWVTAIGKDGALNLTLGVVEARRTSSFGDTGAPSSSPNKESRNKEDDDKEDEGTSFAKGAAESTGRGRKTSITIADPDGPSDWPSDAPWSTTATTPEPIGLSQPAAVETPLLSSRKKPMTAVPDLSILSKGADASTEGALTSRKSRDTNGEGGGTSSSADAPMTSRKSKDSAVSLLAVEKMPPPSTTDSPMTARKKTTAPAGKPASPKKPSSPRPPSPRMSSPRASSSKAPVPPVAPPSSNMEVAASGALTARKSATTPRASSTPRAPSAKAAAMAPAPAQSNGNGPVTGLVAGGKLKMRAGCELESAEAGTLPAGTKVQIVERGVLADGTQRARIALEADATPLGWVRESHLTLQASPLPAAPDAGPSAAAQQPVSAPAVATSSFAASGGKVPGIMAVGLGVPSSGIGGGAFPLLPPSSGSGALTARSTAKAAATATAARATLGAETVAAAAAAARQVVASQAAEIRASAPAPAAASEMAVAKVRGTRPSSPRGAPNTPGRAAPSTPGRGTPSSSGRKIGEAKLTATQRALAATYKTATSAD